MVIIIKGTVINSVNPLSPNSDQHQFSPNNIHCQEGGL